MRPSAVRRDISRFGRRSAGLTLLAAALTRAPRAEAYEAEVRADTYAQAYQVRDGAGAAVISSRRVTQALSLVVNEPAREPRDVAISFRLRLRMDADFGEACDPATGRCLEETRRDRGSDFVPLFAPRTMDLQFAYLDFAHLARGLLDARLGRILQVDPLGFFLFDGARVRFNLGSIAALELLGGLETRAGFPLANGRFERDGLIRADRTGWDPALAPYVQVRASAPTVGVALETAPGQPLYGRLAYRRVWTHDGTSEEKLGAEIDARLAASMRLYARAVYSIPESMLTNAAATAEWTPRHGVVSALEVERYRPTFDLNSIWASFWADPSDEARVRLQLPLSERWVATASWLARRYALGEREPDPGATRVHDGWNTGGAGSVQYLAPAYRASLRARAEGGAIGARGGVDADAWWWALPERVRLDARLSLWQVVDELRPDRTGPSAGVMLGAMLRLSRVADLYADVEDDANRLVGHRLRVMAMLALRGPF